MKIDENPSKLWFPHFYLVLTYNTGYVVYCEQSVCTADDPTECDQLGPFYVDMPPRRNILIPNLWFTNKVSRTTDSDGNPVYRSSARESCFGRYCSAQPPAIDSHQTPALNRLLLMYGQVRI